MNVAKGNPTQEYDADDREHHRRRRDAAGPAGETPALRFARCRAAAIANAAATMIPYAISRVRSSAIVIIATISSGTAH